MAEKQPSTVRGLINAAAGVVEGGLGLAASTAIVEAPTNEAVNLAQVAGSGNIPEFGVALVHAIPDIITSITHSGTIGLVAAIAALEGGRRLISGSIQVHNARRNAGR